ncbi:hypothetical protein R1sor_012230 [Riccia sorocarpa]|uniref:Uncharacterized protein n=1 Tax=Riccia sorocarpa TaxID=122646 RepID=A0ABD3I508_9MARC
MEDPMSPTNHSDPEDAGNEKFVSPSSSAESDELDRLWNRSTAKKLSLSPSRLQNTRRFRREDTKLSSRPEAGEKEYVVEVDEDGHVTGGCLGKDKYLDMLKQLCLRILDLSELKTKDQIRIQMVKRQLDDKFEYRGRDVCMIWFVSEVGLVLRRARSDLHSTWVKLGEQRDSPVPHGIATEQWHRLIDYWLSPSFIKKSQQMKECRSAVKNVNITGRAGTAGLLANMKRKRGSTPPLNEVQNEIAIRKSKQQLKSKTPGVSSVHADNLPDEGLRTSQAESEKDFFAGGSGFQTSAFDSAVSSGQNTTPEIKTFAENLKQEQEALQAEQQELKEGQKEIQKDQSGIKQKLLELDSKIDKLVKVVMNMSEEISPKGVSLQTETHNNIGEDFSRASKDSANSRSPSTALKKKNKLSKGVSLLSVSSLSG